MTATANSRQILGVLEADFDRAGAGSIAASFGPSGRETFG
jgi:hypothetical protein